MDRRGAGGEKIVRIRGPNTLTANRPSGSVRVSQESGLACKTSGSASALTAIPPSGRRGERAEEMIGPCRPPAATIYRFASDGASAFRVTAEITAVSVVLASWALTASPAYTGSFKLNVTDPTN